jgi:serine/threonine-protein kinase
MAYVFEATDVKHDRTVALKVLKPDVASGLAGERFLREIQIVARLSHPHILPLHESGEVDGLLYYSMPFVRGESLRDRLARAPRLTIEEVLRISREVGQALSYAHEQGVIHRDLKPANIMLSGGVAVVTDFGIARALSQSGNENLTHTGLAVGTPTYMSPEQGAGDTKLDQRSDVYSLGCVVYEMLAGVPPFRADSALAMITQHVREPAPDLLASRPDIPVGVARAVGIALAKSPSERFATVDEFVRALETGLTHSLSGLALRRKHAAWRRRIAAAVAILLVVAGAWWFVSNLGFGSASQTEGGPLVAVLAFEHQGPPDEKYFADGVTDEISSRIADVRGIRVVSRASAMQFDLLRHSLRDVADKLGVQYVLVGTIRTDRRPDGTQRVRVSPRLVNVATERDVWRDTLDAELVPGAIFEVQSGIARQVAKALDVALSPEATEALKARPTMNLQAYNAYLRGNLHAVQSLVRVDQVKAIESLQEATRLDPQFALAFARLAQLEALYYSVFDRTPERLREWKAALDGAVALAPRHPQTRLAQGQWDFYARQDVEGALKTFAELRSRQPNNTELLWQLGRVQRTRGDFEGALQSFAEAAALDPRSAQYPFEACTVLWRLKRFDEGLTQIDRAASLAPDWLPTKASRAQFILASGRADEAKRVLETLATELPVRDLVIHYISDPLYRLLWETVLPEPYHDALQKLSLDAAPLDSAEYYRAKGRLYARRGQHALEVAYFDSTRAVLEGRHGAGSTSLFLHVDLGTAYAEVGRVADARVHADSAARAGLLQRDAFRGWFATLELARLYTALHARNEALGILESLKGVNALPQPWLRLDPAFAELHGDPRYQSLLTTP